MSTDTKDPYVGERVLGYFGFGIITKVVARTFDIQWDDDGTDVGDTHEYEWIRSRRYGWLWLRVAEEIDPRWRQI